MALLSLAARVARRIRRSLAPPPPPQPEPAPPEPVAPPTWEALRDQDAAAAVAGMPADYKRYHQSSAMRWVDITGKRVLVVGCNRGDDCAHFINLGAASVVGLDVISEIGWDYTHPAVSYTLASAESMPLPSDSFDLVFAYATLEHVPDIRAAFQEMARVAAPGGVIYSAAAPLWCSRSGPHWGDAFDHDPWPHLRLDAEGVLALAEQARAEGREHPYHEPVRLREFMTDPMLFNRRRADEYLDAIAILDRIDILVNRIEVEKQDGFDPGMVRALIDQGYSALDLFGLTHIVTARKR